MALVLEIVLEETRKELAAEKARAEAAEARVKALEWQVDAAEAGLIEAIEQATNGIEPSDFMLSFPLVRRVWETQVVRQVVEEIATKKYQGAISGVTQLQLDLWADQLRALLPKEP